MKYVPTGSASQSPIATVNTTTDANNGKLKYASNICLNMVIIKSPGNMLPNTIHFKVFGLSSTLSNELNCSIKNVENSLTGLIKTKNINKTNKDSQRCGNIPKGSVGGLSRGTR